MSTRPVMTMICVITSLFIVLFCIQGSSALEKQQLDENRSEQAKIFAPEGEVHSLSTTLPEVLTPPGVPYVQPFYADERRQPIIDGTAIFTPIRSYDPVGIFSTSEDSTEPALHFEINQTLVPPMPIYESPGYFYRIMFLHRTDTKSVDHPHMRSYGDKAIYDERASSAATAPASGLYRIDQSRFNEESYADPFSRTPDYGKEQYEQLDDSTLYRTGGPDEIDIYRSRNNAESSMGGTTRIPFRISPSRRTGEKGTLLPDMIYLGADISAFTIIDGLKDWQSGIPSSPSKGAMKWLDTESGYIHFEWELGR